MIEEIKQCIQNNLGIKCPNLRLETTLGETDLGLDSQEIVDFTVMLEKSYQVKFQECFMKTTSIEDVIKRIQKGQNKTQIGVFEGKVETFLDIACSAEDSYQAIYDMRKWPEKLPHVKRIEVLYDEGMYQEFLMDVLSDTGLIKVRSIRRCLKEEGITFFQPQPPKFLQHHCGGWKFEKTKNGSRVTTWHQWNLKKPTAQELFPAQNNQSTEERVAKLLLSHAELALSTWKNILEKVK